MSFWCLQFSQRTNLKTQIFALAYWGRNFSFVFWEIWNNKMSSKLTDLRVLLSYYLYCDSRPIEFQNQARDYNFVKMKIDMLKKIGNFFLPKFDRKLPKTSSKQTNNMVLANPGRFWNNLDEYGIFNVVRL